MITNRGNQTQAAITAGHKPGEAARRAGIRYAKDPVAARMLEERWAEVINKAKLTSDAVILSAACAIRFDPRKLIENGKVKPIEQWDTESILGLAVLELPDGTTLRINRDTAREQLMKHLGRFKSDNQQKPPSAIVHAPGGRTVTFEPIPKTRKG